VVFLMLFPVPTLLAAVVLAQGCASVTTSEQREAVEELAASYSIPTVSVIFPADQTIVIEGKTRIAAGSATILSRDRLLLTAHQVDAPTGVVAVDGIRTEYVEERRVDGPTDASGWSVLRLESPHGKSYAPLERDYSTEIPVGATVAVVYCRVPTDGVVRPWWETDYERRIVWSRVSRPPRWFDDRRLEEFLIIDAHAELTFGTSGGTVLWLPSGAERPVVIGFNAGVMDIRDETDQIVHRLQLVRRPHELCSE
jgi:hypothetical protein